MPLVANFAEEHRGTYRRQLRRLALRLADGTPLVDALEQTPEVLRDDVGLGDSICQSNRHARTYLPTFGGNSRRIRESSRSGFAADDSLYVRNTADLGIVGELFDGLHRSDA